MSLPIARARRKKVPSIQRSPYLSTLSHSRTESSKPRVVMSQASWSSLDLPVVLDQPHLREHAGELVVAALVGGDERVDARRRRRAARASCRRRPARSRQLVDVPARAARGSRRSRAATGGGRPTARRTAGRGRTRRSPGRARPGEERRLAVLDDEHRVAGLVAGEVGVRGVRRGTGSRCRWRAPCSVPAGTTSRSPGNASASRGPARGGGRRRGGGAGRARGRPSRSA